MKGITPVLLLGTALLLTVFTVTGSHGLLHLLEIHNELALFRSKNRELKSDISEVWGEIYALQTNEFALEKKAREELGFSGQDEIVYIFPKTAPRRNSQ